MSTSYIYTIYISSYDDVCVFNFDLDKLISTKNISITPLAVCSVWMTFLYRWVQCAGLCVNRLRMNSFRPNNILLFLLLLKPIFTITFFRSAWRWCDRAACSKTFTWLWQRVSCVRQEYKSFDTINNWTKKRNHITYYYLLYIYRHTVAFLCIYIYYYC